MTHANAVRGPRPWLSVIVPTRGRRELADTLASIRRQDDADPEAVELVIVGDTHRDDFHKELQAAAILTRGWGGIYWPHDAGIHAWGHPQRSFGQRVARGEWLWWLQDDDVAEPGSLRVIRNAIEQTGGGGVILARAEPRPGRIVWQDREIRHGNIDADCIIAPRDGGRLPGWGLEHWADVEFISECADLWEGQVRWVEDVIARRNPALLE